MGRHNSAPLCCQRREQWQHRRQLRSKTMIPLARAGCVTSILIVIIIASGMVQAWVAHLVRTPLNVGRTCPTDESQAKPNLKAQIIYQTPSPWWWSRSPLQRCGFDEPMLPEGWAALCMLVCMQPLKRLNKFHKLK